MAATMMATKEVTVSIIIPCYNHGKYLQEALDSIIAIDTSYPYEIIIINDGSTDVETIEKLEEVSTSGYHVVHQTNQGLAAARNTGIAAASGKYIIPLDSDNKLHPHYLTTAIAVLEKDNTVDAVYGNAEFFGNTNKIKIVGQFKITKLVQSNYIDACAVFRKQVMIEVGGYDGEMPAMGNEDWELWIRLFVDRKNIYYLNETCFYYRTTNESMRLSITQNNFLNNKEYIYKKHAPFFADFFIKNYDSVQYFKKRKVHAAVNLLLGRIK